MLEVVLYNSNIELKDLMADLKWGKLDIFLNQRRIA